MEFRRVLFRSLRDLLTRAESDGAVNDALARVLEREGRDEDAKAYFHRAIYGRWSTDTVANRQRVRFELIELLARRHDDRELVAELLPFQDAPADSVALRRRGARPGRAAARRSEEQT